jgi:pimeloyl-ACP methyl ester carboxylesterase
MAREISRRQFMQAMIRAGLSVGGASVLAACGAPAPTATPTTAPTVAPATTPTAVALATAAPTVTPELELAIETMYLDLPDGRKLEVRSTGPKDGEILLVHHGTPQAGLPFLPWAEAAAARGLRTVTYSRPGYGGSSSMPGRKVIDAAADAARVVDAFGAKTFWTIGMSGGGPHALACAAALPDRCLATVAVSSVAPYPADGIDWFEGMCQENVREFRLAMQGAAALKPLLQGVVPTMRPEDIEGHPESCLPEADMAQLTGDFGAWLSEAQRLGLALGTDGWQDDDLAFVSDWGFDLRDARAVAIWNGGQDRLVPPAHSVWLAEHIPSARHQLLDSEGHMSLMVKSFEDILGDLLDLAR